MARRRRREPEPTALLAAALAPWPGARVAVAFSGGRDSTALLYAAVAVAPGRVRALHVDHGLDPDSPRWAAAAVAAAAALGVDCAVLKVSVRRDAGHGLEAAARAARYAALVDALARGELLLTAHHADDQSETLLLRAVHGAGPEGLAAMRPAQVFGRGWLLRPWLGLPRRALAALAAASGLTHSEDPSNASTERDRNYLRHAVLAPLARRWPRAAEGIAASAALLGDFAAATEADTATALARCRRADPSTLALDPLLALAPARRGAVLRRWLLDLGLAPPGRIALATIERDLLRAAPDATPAVRWPGAMLRRYRRTLYAGAATPPPTLARTLSWDGRAPLALGPGLGTLAFDRPIVLALEVGPWRGGATLGTGPARVSAQHALQALGVPPWLRPAVPLVAERGRVVALGDLRLAPGFGARLAAAGTRLRWRDGPL